MHLMRYKRYSTKTHSINLPLHPIYQEPFYYSFPFNRYTGHNMGERIWSSLFYWVKSSGWTFSKWRHPFFTWSVVATKTRWFLPYFFVCVNKLTWGTGFVQDLFLVFMPPPQWTSSNLPLAFGLIQGVATVDQGDHPPLMVRSGSWANTTFWRFIKEINKSKQAILALLSLLRFQCQGYEIWLLREQSWFIHSVRRRSTVKKAKSRYYYFSWHQEGFKA